MTLVFNPQLENAPLNTLRDAIDSGAGAGSLQILNGSTVLATLPLSLPSFADESGGQSAANAITPAIAEECGTADGFRFVTSYGAVAFSGDIPADLDLGDTSVGVGALVEVSTFVLTEGTVQAREFSSTVEYPYAETKGDPFFDDVELLMHFDGVDGGDSGAAFIDSSKNAFTFSKGGAAGSPVLSDSDPKFGPTSCETIAGSDGLVYTTQTTAFDFGTGDFTVEWWMKPLIPDAEVTFLGSLGGVTGFGSVCWDIGINNLQAQMRVFGTPGLTLVSSSILQVGVWSHIAFVREGGFLRCYIDGVLNVTNSTIDIINPSDTQLTLGISDVFILGESVAYDEVRVTKGVARYTGPSFDVPTDPFPDQ